MDDPLSLLRQYNVNKKEIIEKNGQIIFGELSWSKNVPTKFLKFRNKRNDSSHQKEYYTLECLLFFSKNTSLSHPVYIQQAAAKNIPIVHRPDRRDLLEYLNGETASCASIDRPNQIKRSGTDDLQETVVKKPRLEDTLQVQRVEQQLAVRLDVPKEAAVNIDNIKSLSEAMSAEKIAAIKAKSLAKKL